MNSYKKDEQFKLKIRLNRGRYTLLFMIILTLVDICVVFQKNGPIMPFSSAIVTYSTVFAKIFRGKSTLYFAICIAVAAITFIALVFCYLKSKKNILFIVFSMCFAIVDSLVLVVLSIAFKSYDSILIVNIIIHAMTVFYFWASIQANKKLSNTFIQDNQNDNTADDLNECNEYIEDNEEYECEQDVDEQDYTLPLRPYRNKGAKPILSGSIKGLNAFVVINNDLAELVINDKVCCEQNTADLDEYEMCVIVNGVEFIFQYRRSFDDETMCLYADNQLLDSLK